MGESWSFIKSKVDEIEKYYGFEFDASVKNDIAVDIARKVIEMGKNRLNITFYGVCVDGKIREANIEEHNIINVLNQRQEYHDAEMTMEKYKSILLKTDKRFTYCEDNNMFYEGLPPIVGRYIIRHKLSHRVTEMLLDKGMNSDVVKVPMKMLFDKYLKSEASIMNKIEVLNEDVRSLIGTLYVKQDYIPLQYIQELILKEANAEIKDRNREQALYDVASEYNIAFSDLRYRIATGMVYEDALKKGLEHKDKYGIVFECGSNEKTIDSHGYKIPRNKVSSNLINYIIYLSKKEEKELGLVY